MVEGLKHIDEEENVGHAIRTRARATQLRMSSLGADQANTGSSSPGQAAGTAPSSERANSTPKRSTAS